MARSADQHRAGPLPKTLTLQGSCGVAHPIPYRRHYPSVEIRSMGPKAIFGKAVFSRPIQWAAAPNMISSGSLKKVAAIRCPSKVLICCSGYRALC